MMEWADYALEDERGENAENCSYTLKIHRNI